MRKRTKRHYPLLRCPVCGYEYTPTMGGWAFATNKDTKCIGKDVVPDGTVSKMHPYNHPFEVVPESEEARLARQRPITYDRLSPREQWRIDKELGDGN